MNKHTAILPDGQVVTRNSAAHRLYSHCVAIQTPEPMLRTRFQEGIAEAKRNEAYYVSKGSEVDAQRMRERVEHIQKRLDAVDGPDEWGTVGWQSRLDLAEKEAARFAKLGYKVQILEAVRP